MTKYKNSNHILFNFIRYIIVLGFNAYAVPYEYSYTLDCLATPLRPQYNGGIVVNPEFNEELKGWTSFGGDAKIEHATSVGGNKYIVATYRNQSFHSFTQTFDLESEKYYTFSAWLQVSRGKADVAAIFKTRTNYESCGWVTAEAGCWSMLKGGLVVKESGPTQLYFETNNTEVDIWADSISLQPFTNQEWESHQRLRIQKVRKTKVRFHVVDKHSRPIQNVTVLLKQTQPRFPFGCAINRNILSNQTYRNWFVKRFNYTVFENELKWGSTEPTQGAEDYSTAKSMVQFAQKHGVKIRGHNILSDDLNTQPSWVRGLSGRALRMAVDKRINSVTKKFKGDFIHWDVVNENLHRSFFEDKLGNPDVSTEFFKMASQIDKKARLFLNEYNTIENYNKSDLASPDRYAQRIRKMRAQRFNGLLGIGLQGHFRVLNLPALRVALEGLAKTKLPMWITELDVSAGPRQVEYLGNVLNELFSTRGVEGIVMWSAWGPKGCWRMCLTDKNFKNLATGDVVDRFMNKHLGYDNADDHFPDTTSTDANGFCEASLYHGDYQVVVARHPNNQFFCNVRLSVLPTRQGRLQVHRLTVDNEFRE